MREKHQKVWYHLSVIWMAVCAAVGVVFSLYGGKISAVYRCKLFGIGCSVSLLMLALMGCASHRFWWLENKAESGGHPPCARRLLLAFLVGTGLQIVYTLYVVRYSSSDSVKDCIVAAGIFCISVMAAHGEFRFGHAQK